jgi:hypothetical protein
VKGIVSVDINTGLYKLLPSNNIDHIDIDGLSFNADHFIGHQSTKVCRFYLSAERDSIIRSDTLDTGKEFDSSTTGETGNGYYHFIVNSQVQSGIDFKKQELKSPDSLENIIIRRIKLKP